MMMETTQYIFAIFSVFVLLSLILVIFGCVCGCRKTVPKNELMGLAGMVKITNPDENVNFSSPALPGPPIVQFNSVADTPDHPVNQASELNKRPNNNNNNNNNNGGGVTSATRSLPDLPVESERLRSRNADWEPNADTSSDLYATVDDSKGRRNGQKPELPRDSTIESSYDSPSQTDNSMSPYARVKREHPYDQVKQTEEHPYAQVRTNGMAGPSHAQDNSLNQSASSSSVDGPESPIAPPRNRKSISLSQSSQSPIIDIPAATAIAGGIPANHELPYMTPPLPAPSQQHFSGDSQDSSKGYTSISVREPLSNILGQVPRRQERIDSHYATVSDDSASVADLSTVMWSKKVAEVSFTLVGSFISWIVFDPFKRWHEMYAAIEEPNQAVYTSGSETYAQIRPMMVAATVNAVRTENLQPPSHHTRQESSSSTESCNVNATSPKPEKRQANSPLPRPPDPASVDEMYAKVMKKRRSSHSLSSAEHEQSPPTPPLAPLPSPVPTSALSNEIVHRSQSPRNSSSSTIQGYETVNSNCASNTEVFCSGYETVEGEHDSLIPGYERVAGGRNETISDSEPNYEELRPQNSSESTYATVNKRKSSRLTTEPDYASLSRKDPGYERVEGFDPNYESVSQDTDPNYESVEKQDPPYEKVQATSSYVPVYNQNSRSSEDVYSKVNKHRTVR